MTWSEFLQFKHIRKSGKDYVHHIEGVDGGRVLKPYEIIELKENYKTNYKAVTVAR